MNPRAGAIDQQIFVVALCADAGEQQLPQALLGPLPKTRIDAFPQAEAGRQISPRRSSSQDPQDGLNPTSSIRTPPATAPRTTQIVLVDLDFLARPVMITQNEPYMLAHSLM